MPRHAWFVLSVLLFIPMAGRAQPGPRPPCGNPPVPDWPLPDAPATVRLWNRAEFGKDWQPPACTGWTSTGFTTLVTTAARFRHLSGLDGLLRHAGAISELAGVRYWSTTHQKWQTLIPEAYALTGPRSGQRRADFTPAEMKGGSVLYFEQSDNLTGRATYRMTVAEATPDRLVFRVENVSAMRYIFLPVFRPGEMQSVYFLDRESDDVWRYYSMMRTGVDANGLVAGNEASAINRAVAFYRAFVGIPTDREPPAAR